MTTYRYKKFKYFQDLEPKDTFTTNIELELIKEEKT